MNRWAAHCQADRFPAGTQFSKLAVANGVARRYTPLFSRWEHPRKSTSEPASVVWIAGLAIVLAAGLNLPAEEKEQSRLPALEHRFVTLTTARQQTLECQIGWLVVPENRLQPNSPTIKVAFARIRSASPASQPAVFVLAQSGKRAHQCVRDPQWLSLMEPLWKFRDLLVLDARSHTDSTGRTGSREVTSLPDDLLLSRPSFQKSVHLLAERSRARLHESGVDPSAYLLDACADDLHDLRRACSMETVHVLAMGEGTLIARAFARRHPDYMGDLVLVAADETNPTLGGRSKWSPLTLLSDPLKQEARAIAADESALADRVETIMNRLDEDPPSITVHLDESAEPTTVLVGRFGLQYLLLREWMNVDRPADTSVLISQLETGDTTLLGEWVRRHYAALANDAVDYLTRRPPTSAVRNLATVQFGSQPPNFYGTIRDFLFPDLDQLFVGSNEHRDVHRQVVTQARTLIVNGSLDIQAPSCRQHLIQRHIPNATTLIVENAAHLTLMTHAPLYQTVASFLAGDDVERVQLAVSPPDGVFGKTRGSHRGGEPGNKNRRGGFVFPNRQ